MDEKEKIRFISNSTLRFPVIRVLDRDYGKTHLVGTDVHDVLEVDSESGGIQYHNLQCCEGTKNYDDSEGHFQFVGKPNSFHDTVIEFVTLNELLEIYQKEADKKEKSKKQMTEMVEKCFDTFFAEKE